MTESPYEVLFENSRKSTVTATPSRLICNEVYTNQKNLNPSFMKDDQELKRYFVLELHHM